MWYAIIGEDRANSLDQRKAARPLHLERIKALQAEGRVLIAGPMPAIDSPDPGPAGFSGSLMVLEFTSLTEAENWANNDPYVTTGVFEKITVKPFNRVLPE